MCVGPAVSKTPVIVGSVLGSVSAILLAVGALLLARWWKRRAKAPVGQFSRATLLRMGASSSENAFKFQQDKAGRLQMLGEGGFGEVNLRYIVTFKKVNVCGNHHLLGDCCPESSEAPANTLNCRIIWV